MFWFRPLLFVPHSCQFLNIHFAQPLSTNTTEQKNQEGCEEPQQARQQVGLCISSIVLPTSTHQYCRRAENPRSPRCVFATRPDALRCRKMREKRTIGGSNPTRASSRSQFLCSKIRASHTRGYMSKRAMWSAEQNGIWKKNCTQCDKNWMRTGPRPSRFSEVWCLPSPSTTVLLVGKEKTLWILEHQCTC